MSRRNPSKSQLIQKLVRPRKGEGALLTTVRGPFEPGRSGHQITIDLSSAPVPDRRYAADAAWIEVGSDMARLYLVQRKAIGAGLQSVLLVRIPFIGVRQFLSSMPTVAADARRFVSQVAAKLSGDEYKGESPQQTFTVDANVIAVAFAGREACMDLYHASPYVIHGLKSGGDFYAEPVARVNMSTQTLLGIYDTLDAQKDSIPIDDGGSDE